ncbi:hypothetical protein SAMN05216480_12350 [Pustulibacterium marinum]|uniref:Uncharacterized protein n=1 Tax=Pustulibacterium marinum TaxID=1224947 RepID=A0A1I7IWR6_9FLAO|nr:hypothetical protein [Pustulibacterium marinum]SFU77376.1 hypothetical protein SAMN05216480_12350 [Pustulibacterium marinum]
MRKFFAKVSNSYKRSSACKYLKSKFFVAKYNDGEYYRFIFDLENDRRQVVYIDGEQMNSLIEHLQSLTELQNKE